MNKKMEYLITFFFNISFCTNSVIDISDKDFQRMIYGFIGSYYNDNKQLMNKMFNIEINNGLGSVYIDFDEAVKYGYLYNFNPQRFVKIYDDIGYKEVNKIMNLAMLFCHYVDEMNDINTNNKIKS